MVNKKKIRKEKQEKPTRIVVERGYLGGQSMEDAFRKINEETVKEKIFSTLFLTFPLSIYSLLLNNASTLSTISLNI